MEQNLTDNTGERIWSNQDYWYKIVLDDGSELGLGEPHPGGPQSTKNGRTFVTVVPSGQGMVFRYQRADGDNRKDQGWPIGDKGYLRGLQVKPDGTEVIKNMSLSWSPPKLCMYDDNSNYGISAAQLPENRVALYAYNSSGTLCGLRVTPDRHIIGHESAHALALDCEFVRVGTAKFTGLF